MRAVGWWEPGGPAVLTMLELPRPEPGPGEMLIRVEAATINPADLSFREGRVGSAITGPPPHVGGLEAAGTVAAAGPGSRWEEGQRVAAITAFIPGGRGAHAEFLLVPDDAVALLPDALRTVEAAVIPMSGLTAQLAVDQAGAAPGTTVAVTGAGGAVGAFAVELAVAAGARVIAVAGAEYADRLRAMGVSDLVARGEGAPARLRELVPGGVDVVIDGALLGEALLPAIRDGGRLIAVRAYSGATERGIATGTISVRVYGREQAKLQRLVDLAAAGSLTPRVAATFPAARAAEAHQRLAAGGAGGRLVLTFG
ncbi:hypothetical protein BL253_20475 [Pseudofrankia asymbiotica]|uniref:Enoyl reductase (ER) domain-containing protein n=2 Tax=Pseudofrankia asymbiotica TaxID=1834516 RepID=A0A1V2I9Z2_9ACTN|nr:hypothetical protein BL253_20475 [Pseudofrankia asymbiotica]